MPLVMCKTKKNSVSFLFAAHRKRSGRMIETFNKAVLSVCKRFEYHKLDVYVCSCKKCRFRVKRDANFISREL